MEELLRYFPEELKNLLRQLELKKEDLTEIRIRKNKPLIFYENGTEFFLKKTGTKSLFPAYTKERCEDYLHESFDTIAYGVGEREFQSIVEKISHFSLYALEHELKQGYFTIDGGHRIGVSGEAVMEHDRIKTLRNLTGLNIRVAHQILGTADTILPYLYHPERGFCNTMIVSPPACGKTTLLRDLIRQISDGKAYGEGRKVGVVDERNEISSSYMGKIQNDLGIRTDVIWGCKKLDGIQMLIRSMSPEVLAVDEIAGRKEAEELLTAVRSGCNILFTIHGKEREDVLFRKDLMPLLEGKVLERMILLSRSGSRFFRKVYDWKGNEEWGEHILYAE